MDIFHYQRKWKSHLDGQRVRFLRANVKGGGLLFSDALNVMSSMGAQLRGGLRALREGESPAEAFKLDDGTVPPREHYEAYIKRTNSDDNAAQILANSDLDAMREFDGLVDEYNNTFLPAVEIGEEFWEQEGFRDGFIAKAEAMLAKIKEFDKRVSV